MGEHPNQPYLTWHGVKIAQPDWGPDSHTLAFTLCHPQAQEQLHVIFNAYRETLTFELPPQLQVSITGIALLILRNLHPKIFTRSILHR